MNPDNVGGNEMNEPHDFDDNTAGSASMENLQLDAHTSALLADLRVAYASVPLSPGKELAALMASASPTTTPTQPRRFTQMRSTMIAKAGATLAAVFAASGGLAVAHALPAPMQNAASSIGIGRPAHHSHSADVTNDTPTTTDPTVDPPTTVGSEDNHGSEVSGVARTPSSDGCEHGDAVSNVASDQRASDSHDNNSSDTSNAPCDTTTTVPGSGFQVSGEDGHGSDNNSGDVNSGDNKSSDSSSGDVKSGDSNSGDGHNSPTTIASTPTTQDNGGDSNSGSSDGGGGSGSNTSDSGSGGSGSSGSDG